MGDTLLTYIRLKNRHKEKGGGKEICRTRWVWRDPERSGEGGRKRYQQVSWSTEGASSSRGVEIWIGTFRAGNERPKTSPWKEQWGDQLVPGRSTTFKTKKNRG